MIKNQLSHAGYSFSDDQVHQFRLYSEEILKWNEKISLTGARTGEEIVRHILISLAFLKFLGASPEARVLDWGSGVGFPGIPLKIACHGLKMDLVESRSKRVSFLKNIIRALGLSGIRCHLARCEDLHPAPESEFLYDYVISRAAGTLLQIVESSWDLLSDRGEWVVLKGKNKFPEIEIAKNRYGDRISITTMETGLLEESEKNYLFVVIRKCFT